MTNTESLLMIINILLGVVLYLCRTKIESIEKELVELRNNVYEFKDNYLDRFEKVNKAIADSKMEIIEKLHELNLTIKNK